MTASLVYIVISRIEQHEETLFKQNKTKQKKQ